MSNLQSCIPDVAENVIQFDKTPSSDSATSEESSAYILYEKEDPLTSPLSQKTPLTLVRRQNTCLKAGMIKPALTVTATPVGFQLSELDSKLDQKDHVTSSFDQPK